MINFQCVNARDIKPENSFSFHQSLGIENCDIEDYLNVEN